MELRQLRWFVAAVEAGSLSAAAREGHITQPALSVMIAQLERAVGARLLERHRDGVRPTAAGLAVVGIARRMLDDAELAGMAARAAAQSDPGVRIAVADLALLPLLAGTIGAVQLGGVGVQVVVGQHRPWETGLLHQRQCDLAVVTAPVFDRRIRTVPLARSARGILVGPRNELHAASAGELTFELLADHGTIDPVHIPAEWTDEWAYRPQMNGERMRRLGPPVDSISATFLSALTTQAVAFVPAEVGRIGEVLGLRYLQPEGWPDAEHLLAWRPPLSPSGALVLAAATGEGLPG